MLEECGDFWDVDADARCITTNGALRRNGNAIMGKGIAFQAREKYKARNYNLETVLGKMIRSYGNHVFYLGNNLFSFPTKHHWRENSDIKLIERSSHEIINLLKDLDSSEWKRILLTRPGCGNGGLEWNDVKSVIQNILDDRFIIVDNSYQGYVSTFTMYI